MRRYLSLYGDFLRMELKSILEYRGSFFTVVAAVLIVQAASLGTIWVVMSQVPSMNGWSLSQVLFIWGLLILSRSCTQIFTEMIWVLGGMLREGDFDRFLVRPIDPLFQVLSSGLNFEGMVNFPLGLVLIIGTGRGLGVFSSPFNILYLVVAILSGAVIFLAVNIIINTTAFWIIDSMPIAATVFENYQFAHYPLTIFPRGIQFLLTWIIPYGFASFYPAAFLMGRDVGVLAWLGPVVAVVVLVGAYRFWLFGLSRYEGTGS
jgi:ABC-2 type transport system permease protein